MLNVIHTYVKIPVYHFVEYLMDSLSDLTYYKMLKKPYTYMT
jgi:hypothetical protein